MNFSEISAIDVKNLLNQFKSSENGLSGGQVIINQTEYGKNVLPDSSASASQIFFRQFKSPFFFLLFVAVLLAVLLSEWIDAGMIMLFVVINVVLGFYQEFKSEQTVRYLSRYIKPKATVIRNGVQSDIDSADIVVGDILVLEPGDIIAADVSLIETDNLIMNETILTGESTEVEKNPQKLLNSAQNIYSATNICFSGTTVSSGKGKGCVFAVGGQTEMGNIARLSTQTIHTSTYEREIYRLSMFILKLILVTLAVVFTANLFLKGSNVYHMEFIIFAIALAVSVIPEALPVVMTFSFSRGALRLAKHKIIVKRLSSVEDLGSIQVLCTDKTGTLTESSLTVSDVISLTGDNTDLLAYLGSRDIGHINPSHTTFDTAVYSQLTASEKKELKAYATLKQIPFTPDRRCITTLLKYQGKYLLIMCGAVEAVMKLSQPITGKAKDDFDKWNLENGQAGNRVLVLAKRNLSVTQIGKIKDMESDMEIVGAVSFSDPIKKTAYEAVKKADLLGVQIKILTGDAPEVARSVAEKIGLINSSDDIIIGSDFDKMSWREKMDAVSLRKVFARVTPRQKHEIVSIAKERNEVGFLGEGINDAPALKVANVSLAVDHATDVAREASDIILLERDLTYIIDGIREGRQILANSSKYIVTTLASNFGNFYSVALASLVVPYLPMLPVQLLLVNLLSDFPMISIATDTVDYDELSKPRKYSIREILQTAMVLGLVSTCFDFIYFGFYSRQGEDILRTSWYIGSILTELLLIYVVRTKKIFYKGSNPSGPLVILSLCAILITVILPFTIPGQKIFSFVQLTPENLLIIFVIAGAYFVVSEVVKRINNLLIHS